MGNDKRWPEPPAVLETYRGTALRMKVQYAVALIRWSLNWLGEVQDMRLVAALDGLAHAKRLRRHAAVLERLFEDAAIAEMTFTGTEEVEADGYTAVLRSGGSRKNWRNDAVMQELIEQAVARERRRFPDVDARTLRRIVTESMWKVHQVGRIEWRSTDLRRHGIDPDEFSDTTPGRASVDLRGPAAYTDEFGPREGQ